MRDGLNIIRMGRGGEGGRRAMGVLRRRRGLFWALLCAARGLGPPPPTRDNAAPCGGCILPACDPSDSEASSAPGASLAPMTSVVGGGGGDSHKSEPSILSFSRSKLYRNLSHIDTNREEAMKGLLTLLYDRINVRFSRPDLLRIFIALGGDSGGEGKGV